MKCDVSAVTRGPCILHARPIPGMGPNPMGRPRPGPNSMRRGVPFAGSCRRLTPLMHRSMPPQGLQSMTFRWAAVYPLAGSCRRLTPSMHRSMSPAGLQSTAYHLNATPHICDLVLETIARKGLAEHRIETEKNEWFWNAGMQAVATNGRPTLAASSAG